MPVACSVTLKTSEDHPKRAVGFLSHAGFSFVNIAAAFEGLDEEASNYFQTSFDYFIDDRLFKHRYHGWKQSVERGIYQNCFVFKYPPHRLYGFLCHPKGQTDKQFYACVLVLHAEKRTWLTDKEELKRVNKMFEDKDVLNAINWPWKKEKKKK